VDSLEPDDRGVRTTVERPREAGVETDESCEGGAGHAYPRTDRGLPRRRGCKMACARALPSVPT